MKKTLSLPLRAVRKTKSFDFLPNVEIKGEWLSPSSNVDSTKCSKIQDRKASRFSSTTRAQLSSTSESTSYSNHRSKYHDDSYNTFQHKHNRFDTAATSILSPSISSSSLVSLELAQSEEGIFTTEDFRSFPIGKMMNLVAVLLLVLARFFSTSGVSNGVDHSKSYDYISPMNYSRTTTSSSTNANSVDRGLLGSAMIGCVTNVLSPILPFAGGVDLRRVGWREWMFKSIDSNDATPKSDSRGMPSIPRGGQMQIDAATTKNSLTKTRPKPIPSLSTPESFIPATKIADLSLGDIAFLLRHAVESGTKGFDISRFISKQDSREEILPLIKAIEDAVQRSRGVDVMPAGTGRNAQDFDQEYNLEEFGDIDALQFCAVCRIIAEWRLLRQVPPGYKGYAVGMTLGHKDVVQNVNKIENAVHIWIEERAEAAARESTTSRNATTNEKEEEQDISLKSPTLRQLLQYEVELDLHPNNKLPRLKEKSAAMGLLWVVRQLQYQTTVFNNVIAVGDSFPSAIDAVSAAYSRVYGRYHGWAVQKIFNYSFQSAPDARQIFRHMNPAYLKKVENSLKSNNIHQSEPLMIEDNLRDQTLPSTTSEGHHIYEASKKRTSPHSSIPIDISSSPNGATNDRSTSKDKCIKRNPFIQVFSIIGSEWEKIVYEVEKVGDEISKNWDRFILGLFGPNPKQKSTYEKGDDSQADSKRDGGSIDASSNNSEMSSVSEEELESYIMDQMEMNAKENIILFLRIARPIIQNLENLIDEMNMNDPTKV